MQFEAHKVYTCSAIVITGGGAEVVVMSFEGRPLAESPYSWELCRGRILVPTYTDALQRCKSLGGQTVVVVVAPYDSCYVRNEMC